MSKYDAQIKEACEKFAHLLEGQLERVERINAAADFVDYDKLDKIVIGICGGDGIGPIITKASQTVLEKLLADRVAAGKVEFKVIDGLITNFHLPESTLIMLVSAFAGYDHTMAAYRTAVEQGYRFYSFGDAMYIR